jgi:hypothetical protein
LSRSLSITKEILIVKHMIDCQMALKYLLIYLDQIEAQPVETEAAIEHISQCPHCYPRLGYLLRTLSNPEEDLLTCRECEALLPDYREAEMAGEAGGTRWRPVARHLEQCPSCAAEDKALSDFMGIAAAGWDLAPSPKPWTPNLSFLPPAPTAQESGLPWHLNKLGHVVVQFSQALIDSWRPPQLAAGLKKSPGSSQILYQFSLQTGAVEDCEFSITAEAKRNDPARCTVVVEVQIPSLGGWPHWAGTEVILKRDSLELERQATDPFGQAVFEDIATVDLPQLTWEIVPNRS